METPAPINEVDMENIPGAANIRTPPQMPSIRRSQRFESQDTNDRTVDTAEKSLTVMLEEAGLADLPNKNVEEGIPQASTSTSQMFTRRRGSESSETMLGSLDRTKVSLGDSDQTTDAKRFIREQWGTEGTMMKILRSIKAGQSPVTVRSLIAKGPVMAGYKKIMAARCFTSILELKQHGFILVDKDPDTLEVKDITLGPVFNIK